MPRRSHGEGGSSPVRPERPPVTTSQRRNPDVSQTGLIGVDHARLAGAYGGGPPPPMARPACHPFRLSVLCLANSALRFPGVSCLAPGSSPGSVPPAVRMDPQLVGTAEMAGRCPAPLDARLGQVSGECLSDGKHGLLVARSSDHVMPFREPARSLRNRRLRTRMTGGVGAGTVLSRAVPGYPIGSRLLFSSRSPSASLAPGV